MLLAEIRRTPALGAVLGPHVLLAVLVLAPGFDIVALLSGAVDGHLAAAFHVGESEGAHIGWWWWWWSFWGCFCCKEGEMLLIVYVVCWLMWLGLTEKNCVDDLCFAVEESETVEDGTYYTQKFSSSPGCATCSPRN